MSDIVRIYISHVFDEIYSEFHLNDDVQFLRGLHSIINNIMDPIILACRCRLEDAIISDEIYIDVIKITLDENEKVFKKEINLKECSPKILMSIHSMLLEASYDIIQKIQSIRGMKITDLI